MGINHNEPTCEYWPVKPSIVGADQIASAEWDRLKMVAPARLYTAMDEGPLTQYCLAWSQMLRAQELINTHGILISTPICTRDGDIVGEKLEANPALPSFSRASDMLFKCGDRLGLSPSTRARINMPSKAEIKSRFSGLLGRQDDSKTAAKAR
jgi:P27 family predicted phage terminase small subunit